MDVHSVGPDDLCDEFISKKYEWVVYWYEADCHDGYGEAISWDGGQLRAHDLTHCSCNCAEDDLNDGGCEIDAGSFEVSDSVLDTEYRPEVVRKVKELLGSST